jgi:hypothetical protein
MRETVCVASTPTRPTYDKFGHSVTTITVKYSGGWQSEDSTMHDNIVDTFRNIQAVVDGLIMSEAVIRTVRTTHVKLLESR